MSDVLEKIEEVIALKEAFKGRENIGPDTAIEIDRDITIRIKGKIHSIHKDKWTAGETLSLEITYDRELMERDIKEKVAKIVENLVTNYVPYRNIEDIVKIAAGNALLGFPNIFRDKYGV